MRKYHYTEADFTTKKAAQESLLKLLNPLKPFYSDGCALLDIGATSAHYDDETAQMEAFTRPLWGLAPFWMGGGSDSGFEKIYTKGLASGTDPNSPEYWNHCHDFDQKFVEMAGLAYAMLLAPDKVWEPLSDEEKDNLTSWLWEINEHECCACNWQWFAVLTNLALKVCGRAYSKERIELGLQMMEGYYDAGGWYRDGNNGDKDYYNPYVMLSFGLIYAMFMEDEEPERCRIFRERAIQFASDYQYWFSDDGASIAYGRSMTYRFAQCSFWAMALLSGTEVLPVPVIKGIITRHLTWWLNQPICDNAGILTIGYAYPNLQMSESYNGPGSPYWATMAFAFLGLPDDHPYWTAEAAPMPELESLKYLENAGMLMQRGNGNVVALVPGRRFADGHSHTLEKYAKFAYSSKFGFSISRSSLTLYECAPDSTLTFEVDGIYHPKSVTEEFTMDESGITISWSPVRGIHVETEIRPTERGHIRTHKITSEISCKAYDTGFAVTNQEACKATSLKGNGKDQMLYPDPNTNLIATKTVIPMSVYEIHEGAQVIETEFCYL
ncbi:MAG: DUF2264 domain-containing protein [Oscillospiraceae bacterium]|nr:DUF2264 domain-containing protein [Oscillospiraceae bacterium]